MWRGEVFAISDCLVMIVIIFYHVALLSACVLKSEKTEPMYVVITAMGALLTAHKRILCFRCFR